MYFSLTFSLLSKIFAVLFNKCKINLPNSSTRKCPQLPVESFLDISIRVEANWWIELFVNKSSLSHDCISFDKRSSSLVSTKLLKCRMNYWSSKLPLSHSFLCFWQLYSNWEAQNGLSLFKIQRKRHRVLLSILQNSEEFRSKFVACGWILRMLFIESGYSWDHVENYKTAKKTGKIQSVY